MRIVALGGSGGMGNAALHITAAELRADEIVVADLDEQAAAEVAAELRDLGQPASSEAIDVADHKALLRLLAGAGMVMNSVGPYFRFGVPVLEAAIESGCRYIDLCDDAQPTIDMLALDEQARAAGVTAIIGAGASPGLMNVFARIAADGLDRVDDVTVGWTLNNLHRHWDMMRASQGRRGNAALMHFFEQFTNTVPAYVDGKMDQRRARQRIPVDVPGLGRGTGYLVGHPEPVTLPRTLPAHGSSVSLCLMSSDRAALLDRVASELESGSLDLAVAIDQVREAVADPRASDGGSYPGNGDLPIYLVLLSGEREGSRVLQYIGCVTKPQPMTVGTGVPYGIATAILAGQSELPAGVFPLDAVIEPEPYLSKVAQHWGVPRDQLYFTGTVPVTEAAATPAH